MERIVTTTLRCVMMFCVCRFPAVPPRSLLNHNCNNFTSHCSKFLLNGTDIPSYITGLPEEVVPPVHMLSDAHDIPRCYLYLMC